MSASPSSAMPAPAPDETCAQCSKSLTPSDRVASGDRAFCRSCYTTLRAELENAVNALSQDVNYASAALGAVLGGVVGALVWWGFTVVTHIGLGLIAIGIGFLVGLGAVKFAGGKRSKGLQALSVGVAVVSYFCAGYLVNMTFINQALAAKGESFRVGFPPASLDQFVRVLSASFDVMDWVFLAIVVYQAWKIPKPITLPPDAAA